MCGSPKPVFRQYDQEVDGLKGSVGPQINGIAPKLNSHCLSSALVRVGMSKQASFNAVKVEGGTTVLI
jgi:hypothetical protein